MSARPCGSVAGPPKLTAPATTICGKPSGRFDAVGDAEIHGVEGGRGERAAVLHRPAEAGFVQQSRAEHVRFVHRQRALRDRAALAESGNVGALRIRFDDLNLLAPEIHLQAIARAGVVPHIRGPRVLVDPGVGRADKPRRAVGIDVVRARDERDQLPDDRVRHRGPLRVARHHGVQVDPLALPQAFVGGEEERAVAADRAAIGAAELVALERVRIRRVELEKVARVERVVAEEFVGLAAELIGARARDEVDDRARDVAVLRAERRVVDLEFLDARDRRRKADRSERQVVRRHAVDDVGDRFFAVAGRVERERAGAANRRRRKTGLRRRHRPGHERPEIDEVPAVERHLLDGLLRRRRGRRCWSRDRAAAARPARPRLHAGCRPSSWKSRTSVRPTSKVRASMRTGRKPGASAVT